MADLKNGSTSLKSNNLLKDGIEKYGIEREREREREQFLQKRSQNS